MTHKLAHEATLANLESASRQNLKRHKHTFTAAETRFKQPVHLEASLNEAEAASGKPEHPTQESAIRTQAC